MSDHDPFAPPDANPSSLIERRASGAAYAAFPEDRWRGAGADDDDVAALREAHDRRSPDEQAVEGQRLAGASREALVAELEALRATGDADNPFGTTVDDVKETVGENVESAKAALEIEQARPKPRKTLVEHLQGVIEDAAPPVEDVVDEDAADASGG